MLSAGIGLRCRVEMAAFRLMSLPPELHILVSSHLEFPDYINLKRSCVYFYNLIPSLSHAELLEAESTEFAVSRNLYACRYCRRLRPAKHFADRMLCRGRGRRGQDARRRFCIQCGLAPRGECGEARYGRGAEIWIQGVLYVVCKDCRRFAQGRPGLDTPRCWWCWEKGFCRPRPCS